MPSITLSVPEKTRELMKRFPEINWSALVRLTIESKAKRLAWKEHMLQQLDSEREFDELALEIGDKIKQGMWERYKEEGW